MYQLAIFDLDGTLLDTLADLRQGINYALGTQGFAPRSMAEVRAFVGNGIWKLVERAVPAGTSEAQMDAVYEAFNPYYAKHCADLTAPYDGILPLLQKLQAQGVVCALVNLGGNILTLGEKADGSPWTIAVDSPFGEGYAGRIEVGGGKAVATSSGAQRYFEKDGMVYHHILDPETGYPARSGLASVTVIADDGLTADALSTALFVAGEAQAAHILEEQYPNVGAVLIRDDGSIRILGNVCFTEEAGA